MPHTPRENIEKWDRLAEIYYYSYFITSWISFNSWYNYSYPTLVGDRTVINQIKNHNSPVKSRFISLLKGTNQESKQFQENIAQLHHCLLNHDIRNEEQRIWFDSFVVELDRSNLIITQSYNGIHYHVGITVIQGEINNVVATVKNSVNVNLLVYNHTILDISHLRRFPQFIRLSQVQKSTLEGHINNANPKKPICLLTTNALPDCIEVGQFKLLNDEGLIFKAVIEMLYSLRNNLFHGNLTPSPEANKVYEAAYRILKQIVEGIK
ncbi:MAG TPA: hypothetical protein VIM16_09970 [Mucilaginibacter sp.]|jgi:hypothetical protein